jgi:cobalt transporter subunit CbtA
MMGHSMFRTIVFSAFGAALAVCLAVSALQFFTTEPLILHAEQFEGGAVHDHDAAASSVANPLLVLVHTAGTADAAAVAEEWAPADGIERTLFTVLANFVIAFAVSLLLLGAMVLRGDPIDARLGLLWGIAGFAAISLLPALGLPPELPGTPAADILERQTWWLATAGASAAGIALLVFGRSWALMAAGVVLIVAPHVVGAPPPPSHDVTYPGALAGEFVVASLVVGAALWSLSGLAAGWFYQRFSGAR